MSQRWIKQNDARNTWNYGVASLKYCTTPRRGGYPKISGGGGGPRVSSEEFRLERQSVSDGPPIDIICNRMGWGWGALPAVSSDLAICSTEGQFLISSHSER